jgi:hypothetical protein
VITAATVQLLRTLWDSDIRALLQNDLDQTHLSMEKAVDVGALRALQGKAAATRALFHFPEQIAMRIDGRPEPGYALESSAGQLGLAPPPLDPRAFLLTTDVGIPVSDEDDA